MAKIIVTGDAVVIKSALKLEDIRTIATYRPKDLILMGGEDGKEPVFAIGLAKGAGSISSVGASFAEETHDPEKLATITMICGDIQGNAKEWAAERVGAAIISLNKLEAKLPEVLEEIKKERAEVLANISVQ